MSKYLNTAWKYSMIRAWSPNPQIPWAGNFYTTIANMTASSETDLTVVRLRYDLTLTGNIVFDALGKSGFDGVWWADLGACYRFYVQGPPFSVLQDPFGAGFGETDGIADGGLQFAGTTDYVDNATGFPAQTVTLTASGNSEGARRLPGPDGVQVIGSWGFAFDSYAAGLFGSLPTVSWHTSCYAKTLFGSATGIT